MSQVYMKGIVRLEGRGRQGIGLELFRADSEGVELSESEQESIGESDGLTAIMRVYEHIGEDFFTGGGITASKFAKVLNGLGKVSSLNLHINCLGGDCFTAHTIYNIIRDYECEKRTTYIDGVCASAATIIASAADEVVARANTTYMIHLPWAVVVGNAPAMHAAADKLEKLTEPIVAVYKEQVKGKTKISEIRELMENETWMTAKEALNYGFVDSIKGKIKGISKAKGGKLLVNNELLDVAKYHYENVPDYPEVNEVYQLTERPLEKRKEEDMAIEITKETLAKDYPLILAEIHDEARKAERKRLSELTEMKTGEANIDALVDAAIADGRQPIDIAMECFKLTRDNAVSSAQLDAMKRDGNFSVKAGSAPTVKVEDSKTKATNLLAKAFAEHNNNNRQQKKE